MTGQGAGRGRILVVGGGAVGLAFAAASADEAIVLESGPPRASADPEEFDIRVFALSEGTRAFLREFGAWSRMPADRLAPVTRMEVFGDDGASRLDFMSTDGRPLAWIAEGNRMSRAIEEAAVARGVEVRPAAWLQSFSARAEGVEAVLAANAIPLNPVAEWVRNVLRSSKCKL